MLGNEQGREQAIKAVKRKREFKTHAVVYLVVNAFLVVVWYLSGAGYFWPGWVLGGWGIGLAANAWVAYARQPDDVSEDEIQREMDRRRSAGR